MKGGQEDVKLSRNNCYYKMLKHNIKGISCKWSKKFKN